LSSFLSLHEVNSDKDDSMTTTVNIEYSDVRFIIIVFNVLLQYNKRQNYKKIGYPSQFSL